MCWSLPFRNEPFSYPAKWGNARFMPPLLICCLTYVRSFCLLEGKEADLTACFTSSSDRTCTKEMGEVFCLQFELCVAYSLLMCLDALLHCKRKKLNCKQDAPAVSKKPIVSRTAPKHNCKQRSSTASRRLLLVSKKFASQKIWLGEAWLGGM